MHSATSFVEAVAEYCAWAESEPAAPEVEARTALRLLVRLYADALTLEPPVDIDYDLVIAEGDLERPRTGAYARLRVPNGWH